MTIAGYPLSTADIALMAIVCFFVGFTKTGIMGLNVVITPIAAMVFGKEQVGLVLPMMVFADSFAVIRYRQHANWNIIWRLLPWVVPGLAAGGFALAYLDEKSFKPMLGGIILGIIVLYFLYQWRTDWIERSIPHTWWFAACVGLMAGFVTTIGNISGAIMTVFMLSVGLQKNEFMGTSAWFYGIVNVAKIPVLMLASRNLEKPLINAQSLHFDLLTLPLIACGAIVGILTFRRIPQKLFYGVVLALAALAALNLIFDFPKLLRDAAI